MDWLLGGCCGPGGSLVWTAPPVQVGAGAAVAIVVLLAALRPLPRGWLRAGELALLALGLGAALWMVAEPAWVQEGERVEEGRRVVLVDASRSMSVRDADGQTRAEAAAALLATLPEAEVYSFGAKLRPGAPSGPGDADTDLGGALDALHRRYAGERLKSVVVITDGIDRGGLRAHLGDAGSSLPPIGGPLTIFQVGEPGSQDDVAITDIHAGGFAFLRTPFKLDVDVVSASHAGRSVPVSLTQDGQPVGSARAQLDAEGRGTAHFEVRPGRVGRFLYEASVPLEAGDVVPANNTLAIAVRVVRDRMRVLQVCGSPSWDEKFLRLFLKEDPSVDLVSFFILRTPRDMGSGYGSDELSLIGFPYQRLFGDQITSFDLVIFQNFDYEPYFEYGARELLANVADYVRNGGAFVMMGGDRSFDLGKYANTPLADVLPVELGVTGAAVDEAPFRPVLTEAGARHPITSLAGDPTENASAWAGLSTLDGLNRTLGPRSGAAVLLEHPSLKDGSGRPLPVVAVSPVDKGRSMAITADSSWRWSFAEAAAGRGNQAYLRFWKNAMRWLVGDPEDRPVLAETAHDNYQPGEEAELTVKVRDTDFAPVAGALVTVEVSGPGGRRRLDAKTGPEGVATVPLPTEQRGAWRVLAKATRPGGAALGEAQTVYAVTTRDPELDEIAPDAAFLGELARRAGGRFVPAGQRAQPVEDPESGRRLRDHRETPLGTAPLAPLIAGLALSGSWALRRRAGLR